MNTRSTPHRFLHLVLALAAASAVAAAPARAWERYNDNTWADGRLVDVQLSVAGRPAPLFLAPQSDDRRYFQAFAGRNYSLVLRNNTGDRIGVLIAVDGLNVVNGAKSRLQGTEPMYVLGPWETTTIQGWRTSLDDVQKFVFVDEQRSYAARTGQANADMGWIRVQAYREQRPAWDLRGIRGTDERRRDFLGGNAPQAAPPAAAREAREPVASAPAPQRAQGEMAPTLPEAKARSMNTMENDRMAEGGSSFPGTGWGEHRSDPVQQVQFTAERRPTDALAFRYEYASGLRALGIFPNRDRLSDRDRGQLGFAKPPRW